MGTDMLEDAMFVIPSPDVLTPAVQKHRLRDLETLNGMSEDEAVTTIAASLDIRQLSTGVIELRFAGPNRLDTPRITNAVADEYIERQTKSFESESAKLKSLLETDRRNIERQLKAAEEEYDTFKRESVFLSSAGGVNQPLARLTQLNSQISRLDIEEAELASRVNLLDQKLREGGQREALLMLIGKTDDAKPELPEALPPSPREVALQVREKERRKLSESLLPYIVEATILQERVGPSHPKLLEVRKRIELIRQEYTRMETPVPGESEKVAWPAMTAQPDFLAIYRQSLNHELEKLQSQRAELQEMAAAAEREAHLVQNANYTESRLKNRVDRLQNQYDSIATKIDQTEVNADMSGVRAKKIRAAENGFLIYPTIYRFVGVGGVLGAILGLMLGYVVELADRSFRKPEEVVREFGMPILGHIPYMKDKRLRTISDKDAAKMDRTLVTAHMPRSRAAEAYRFVRTAIFFSAQGASHRVVQVTSPAAGEGKSNLAVSLAQSGQRTVLVESDFRRPSVHRIVGVSNKVGVVDILRGDVELADALQYVPIEDLAILPCGTVPRNPSELLTRPEYEALLEVLRQKFDYVVVDTPPVLVVTDPCSVAPRADAVIVCMRLNRHTREFGRRAFGQLRDVGANVVGMVINGVEESDAYGYGTYNYSESSAAYQDPSFAYAYNFTEGNEGYFAEDDESVPVKRLMKKP